MCLKPAGWVANSVDLDHIPQSGVWSGSTLFAHGLFVRILRVNMVTIKNSASINMTADRCTQRRIRSVYATAQSDRSLGWAGLGAVWIAMQPFQSKGKTLWIWLLQGRADLSWLGIFSHWDLIKVWHHMYRTMRKRVFRHMRIANVQISLRIRAAWSGPSLSANRIIWYYRMYDWRAKTRMIRSACTRWCESAYFAHVRRHFFAWRDPIMLVPGYVRIGLIQIF